MSIFSWIANRIVGYMKAESFPPEFLRRTAEAQKFSIPSGDLWKSQAELYQRLSWVHAVVGAVAESCAVAKFEVKKMVGEKTESIVNHPYELLLQKPNPLMSRFEFFVSSVSFYLLTGNAYWWLNRDSEDEEPQEQWIIPSHMIAPVPDERMFISGYAYDPGDGRTIPLPTYQIQHFKNFHPLNTFVGLSPIEALAVVAIGDMKMQEWNTGLFANNNARLPGILAFADQIAKPTWDVIQKDTQDAAKTRNILMLRGAGKGGVQWMQAASTMRDMEFLNGRKFTKEEIFNIYAPGFASMTDVSATEANAKAGMATYRNGTIHPLLTSMAEKITISPLPAYGPMLKGEFEDVRLQDRAMELQEQAEFAKTHTIDEVREKFYDGDKLGDDRGEMLVAQIGAAPVKLVDGEVQPPIPATGIFGPREVEEEIEEPDEEAVKAELGKWQRKAERKFKKSGSAHCLFESDILPIETRAKVMGLLGEAKIAHDIGVIFDEVRIDLFMKSPIVEALKEATAALRESNG